MHDVQPQQEVDVNPLLGNIGGQVAPVSASTFSVAPTAMAASDLEAAYGLSDLLEPAFDAQNAWGLAYSQGRSKAPLMYPGTNARSKASLMISEVPFAPQFGSALASTQQFDGHGMLNQQMGACFGYVCPPGAGMGS